MDASGSFKGQPAPCGRIVDGEHFGIRTPTWSSRRRRDYACGCRSIQHEYHDGTVSQRWSATTGAC